MEAYLCSWTLPTLFCYLSAFQWARAGAFRCYHQCQRLMESFLNFQKYGVSLGLGFELWKVINTSWLLPSKCRCSTTPSLLPEPRPQRPSRRTRESALSIVRTQVHSIDWADEREKCVLLSGDSRNSSAPWEIPVQNQLWERRSGSQTTNI